GQPTAILEQRVGAPTADAVREWEEKLRQLFGPGIDAKSARPPDPQSEGCAPKGRSDKAPPIVATPLAAVPLPAKPAIEPDLVAQVEPIAPGRGGGSPLAAGPSRARDASDS